MHGEKIRAPREQVRSQRRDIALATPFGAVYRLVSHRDLSLGRNLQWSAFNVKGQLVAVQHLPVD